VECKKVHFIGIYGSGMSALAQFLCQSGCEVTGSDRGMGNAATGQIHSCLSGAGCRIYPQDATAPDSSHDACIVSTAIEESIPDVQKANELRIPLFHRSRLLGAIAHQTRMIAVAGTSGKSSVSAMILEILMQVGIDPSFIAGARAKALIERGVYGNAWKGESDMLIAEADESDGSLVNYEPYLSVILNLSKDHKSVDEVRHMFHTLQRNSSACIVNRDDPGLDEITADAAFGTGEAVTYRIGDVGCRSLACEFAFNGDACRLAMPGMHNVYNFAAAAAVCERLGVARSQILSAASRMQGVKRRFEIRYASTRGTVIDDYAHNPAKIAAALQAAQKISKRVIALFQPHGFKPLEFFRDELIDCLRRYVRTDDVVILLPVYYAGGTAPKRIHSADIADALEDALFEIYSVSSRDECSRCVQRIFREADTLLLMGARDPSLSAYAEELTGIVRTRLTSA
jgi:UDP-N-acetylmuramate--alanine ligase